MRKLYLVKCQFLITQYTFATVRIRTAVLIPNPSGETTFIHQTSMILLYIFFSSYGFYAHSHIWISRTQPKLTASQCDAFVTALFRVDNLKDTLQLSWCREVLHVPEADLSLYFAIRYLRLSLPAAWRQRYCMSAVLDRKRHRDSNSLRKTKTSESPALICIFCCVLIYFVIFPCFGFFFSRGPVVVWISKTQKSIWSWF